MSRPTKTKITSLTALVLISHSLKLLDMLTKSLSRWLFQLLILDPLLTIVRISLVIQPAVWWWLIVLVAWHTTCTSGMTYYLYNWGQASPQVTRLSRSMKPRVGVSRVLRAPTTIALSHLRSQVAALYRRQEPLTETEPRILDKKQLECHRYYLMSMMKK